MCVVKGGFYKYPPSKGLIIAVECFFLTSLSYCIDSILVNFGFKQRIHVFVYSNNIHGAME